MSTLEVAMSDHTFSKFKKLNLETVWRILRKKLIGHGYFPENECPVPFIETANYFDIYNVFVIHATKPKYQFLCKLPDVLRYPDREVEDMKKLTEVIQERSSRAKSRREDFTLHIKNQKANERKELLIRVEGLKKFTTLPQFANNAHVKINRQYPGMQGMSEIMVITEVLVANKVHIMGCCGAFNEIDKWTFTGVVPLAFTATKMKFGKNNIITKEKQMSCDTLFKPENWARMVPAPYRRCPVLQQVLKGKPYNITVPLTERTDLQPIQLKKELHGEQEPGAAEEKKRMYTSTPKRSTRLNTTLDLDDEPEYMDLTTPERPRLKPYFPENAGMFYN